MAWCSPFCLAQRSGPLEIASKLDRAQIGAYLLLIQPFRRSAATAAQNETVEEVMKHKVFNWYNCISTRFFSSPRDFHSIFIEEKALVRHRSFRGNPVYVLKCAYFKAARGLRRPGLEAQEAVPQSHLTGDEALLYRRGKEYLFIPKEKRPGP